MSSRIQHSCLIALVLLLAQAGCGVERCIPSKQKDGSWELICDNGVYQCNQKEKYSADIQKLCDELEESTGAATETTASSTDDEPTGASRI